MVPVEHLHGGSFGNDPGNMAAALIGTVIVVGLLMRAPTLWWLALMIAWGWSSGLALAAILPARTASMRGAKTVTLWLAVANLAGVVCLTYPYWSEWLKGRFFCATMMSMWIYGLIAAAWIVVTIVVALTTASSRHLLKLSILIPGFIAITLLGKWGLILAVGMEPFHNKMGLGMEVLAYVPNLVIDGLLILSAAASTVAACVLSSTTIPTSNGNAAEHGT
jgi:hypothetical protein